MPPQYSEDDVSDAGLGNPVERAQSKSATPGGNGREEADDALMVETDEEDDEDEIGEDEYVVERITNHMMDDETGEIKYEVKWEGYEKKSDRTWEPEENLETAAKILNEYLASVGGKEAILEAFEEIKAEQAAKKKGRKRGRGGGEESNGTTQKRNRKNHPGASTPPASTGKFVPPPGSWEEEITKIDACEGRDGEVIVYLTWKHGDKTQHPLEQVYKRCPQKMLQFYQSHLIFRKSDPEPVKFEYSDDYKSPPIRNE